VKHLTGRKKRQLPVANSGARSKLLCCCSLIATEMEIIKIVG